MRRRQRAVEVQIRTADLGWGKVLTVHELPRSSVSTQRALKGNQIQSTWSLTILLGWDSRALAFARRLLSERWDQECWKRRSERAIGLATLAFIVVRSVYGYIHGVLVFIALKWMRFMWVDTHDSAGCESRDVPMVWSDVSGGVCEWCLIVHESGAADWWDWLCSRPFRSQVGTAERAKVKME